MLQVVLPIFLLAFFVFMFYWRSTTEFGSDIARQLLPQNLLVGLLFVLGVNLNWSLFSVLMTVYALVGWFFWLRHMLRKPATSQVLLRWKRAKETGEIVAMIGALLLGILLLGWGLTRQPIEVVKVYLGLLLISLVPVMTFEKDASLTENGVDTGRDYIRWEQIVSYRWSEPVKPVIHLFFKTSRRLPIINLVQFDVPYEEKDAVNEIVLRKVQSQPATSDKTSLSF